MRSVDKLYKTIQNAEKKLAKIRAKCKHKKFTVRMYSWRIGSMQPQRLCNRCDSIVPGITDLEAKPFFDSLYGGSTAQGSSIQVTI
jgi:hypothetical protein